MPQPSQEPLSGSDLAAFVLAVETGSLSAAADALSLTQSAVTKRIAALESRLQARVLARGRFGVRATDAGRLLYPEAKHALEALRHAAEVVADHSAAAPVLQLAASHTIGEFLLPGWLASFRLREPERPRAQVEIANSRTVLALVRGGSAQVGFIESGDPAEGLTELEVCRDEIVAVVAPSHPWATRRSVAAAWLAEETYIAREPGSGTRGVASTALRAAGIELAPAIEVASTQSLKRSVLAGGFTLVSRLAVEAEERQRSLRALPVAGVDLSRPLRAVRLARGSLAPAAERFWRHLRALAQGAGPAAAERR